MSTLSDARREALEAQGFTGALPELTLQWLQANGATSDQLSDAWMEMLDAQYLGGPPQQPNLHVNPSLVGGGVSGPGVGSFPPDGYTIGFNTVTSGPHEDGWITNPDEDTGRSYLAYSLQDNHPDLVVGQTYAYRVRVANTSTTGSPLAITVTGDANITVEAITDRVPLGQTAWLHINITIDAVGYTGQIRVGTGVTSNRSERYVIQRGATFRDTEELPDGREMPGQRNDLWYALLGELGYIGALPERERQFWLDGGLFYPPLPESQWTIGQSGDDYGYGPGYGGLNPDGTVDLSVLILSADAGSNLVTMAFSGPVLYQGITVAAEGIGVTQLLPVADDTYNAVDPTFTAAVVAALGTTVPVAALPTGAVIPPQWTSSIPNGRVYLTDTYTYNVSRHIGYHPYFPVTGYSLAPGAPAGASIDQNGVFRLTGEPEDDYPITVIATNLVGDSPSNVFTIEVYRLPPVIDTQPQDVEVLQPAPATFTVEASHPRGADLFYQWHAWEDGAWQWVDNVFPGRVTGAQSDTFTLDPTEFDDTREIMCRVRAYDSTGDGETVISDSAQLTVNRVEVPPIITEAPDPVVVVEPAGASFEVEAYHPDGEDLFYQWEVFSEGAWVDADTVLDVAGGTDQSPLMVLSTTDASVGTIPVRVEVFAYSYGSDQSVTTFPVLLSVRAVALVPPVIIQQPQDQEALIGSTVTFTVVADHPDDVLLYQWEQQFVDVDGVNTATLTVNNVSNDDSGLQCRCRVRAYNNSGEYQVFSEWAELTVSDGRVPPQIDVQPVPDIVIEGDTADFHVEASHPQNADLFYFWQCRGLNTPGSWFAADHPSEGLSSVEGADTPDMLVTNTELTDTRDIRVTVYAYEDQSDRFVISDEVDLEVQVAGAAPIWDYVDAQIIIGEDLPVQVDMNDYILSGDGLENWTLDGNPAGVTIDNTTGIVTYAAEATGVWFMSCTVENIFGSATSRDYENAIAIPPVVMVQPYDIDILVPAGGTNYCEAEHPDPNAPLYYKWEAWRPVQGDWTWLQNVMSDIGSATGTILDINSTNQQDIDASPIRARVLTKAYIQIDGGADDETHPLVTASDEYEIVVRPQVPPDIDEQPEDVSVTAPAGATFSVVASHPQDSDEGDIGLFYEWQSFVGGDWISPADAFTDIDEDSVFNATLIIRTTEESDDGIQSRCVVRAYTVDGPEAISDTVTLTVAGAPSRYAYQANEDTASADNFYYAQVDGPENPTYGNQPFEVEFMYYDPDGAVTTNQNPIMHNGFSRSSRNYRLEKVSNSNQYLRFDVDGFGALDTPNQTLLPETWYHIRAGYDGSSIYIFIDGEEMARAAFDAYPGNRSSSHIMVFNLSLHAGYSPQMYDLRITEDGGNVNLYYPMDETSGLVMVEGNGQTEWNGVLSTEDMHQIRYGDDEPGGGYPPNWNFPITDFSVTENQLPYTIDLDDHCLGADDYIVTEGPGSVSGSIFTLPAGLALGDYVNNVQAINEHGNSSNGPFTATVVEVPEALPPGTPRIFFTDCTDASVMPWSLADQTLGQVITIYGRHFGMPRGGSFVRIGGIDLTDEKYYHPGEPWGERNKPVPFVERITIHIPVELATDTTVNITVVTSEGESNAMPMHIHDVPYRFVEPEGSGDFTFENPGSPYGLSAGGGHTPGEAIFMRGGTYSARHDGGLEVFWCRTSRYGGTNGTAERYIKYIGAPGEDAFIFCPTETGQDNGIVMGAEYSMCAKFRMDTIRQAVGFNQFTRCVGCDVIGLREYRGQGTGTITPTGRHSKTLGNRIHGSRSDDKNDHAIYVSETMSDPAEDGLEHVGGGEVAFNYVFDHTIDTGGMFIRNMQGTDRIRDGWLSEGMHWHHNYCDGRSTEAGSKRHQSNVCTLGNDGQRVDEDNNRRIVQTPDRFYNNIIVGTDHPNEGTALVSISGRKAHIFNNFMYSWGGDATGGGISVNRNGIYFPEDVIEWRNNIMLGTNSTARYVFAEVDSRGRMEAGNNLYWGAREGTTPSLEVDPTYGDPLFYMDVEEGIFRLEADSPAVDLGTAPLLEDQEYDFNAIDYGAQIDSGAAQAEEE